MNRTTLPINEIIIENRQRQDYGDISELAESILRYGLIQPIVINQNKVLIAGGRRLAAHSRLNLLTIDVVFRETLSQDELHELELEENVRRKEMTWQERALNILTIHRLKKKNAALAGTSWGQRETAEMLCIKSASNINYAIRTAELLEKKDPEILACDSLSDAWRIVMRREEDDILAELAKRTLPIAAVTASKLSIEDDILNETSIQPNAKDTARIQYLSNPHNDPADFDAYYESRLELRSKLEQHQNAIPISGILYRGDSIQYMLSNPERFDHIITDIPYGIDMDMLNQQNPGGQMFDIDTVLTEHTVEGNEELFRQFFPAAYVCLKPNAFLVTWCDFWQARYMADLAIAAGFKVQRWPITWVKAHRCMNQSANTNFTKTTEIALVCRKGVATLTHPDVPCHVIAAHDDMKETLGHPFVKPFAIWQHIIEAVSLENQLILEPFAGRGSGVISALRLRRKVIGCELNEQHYNALVENVKQHYLSISSNFTFV